MSTSIPHPTSNPGSSLITVVALTYARAIEELRGAGQPESSVCWMLAIFVGVAFVGYRVRCYMISWPVPKDADCGVPAFPPIHYLVLPNLITAEPLIKARIKETRWSGFWPPSVISPLYLLTKLTTVPSARLEAGAARGDAPPDPRRCPRICTLWLGPADWMDPTTPRRCQSLPNMTNPSPSIRDT
ncbi:hypothetical protein F4803DRAFT_283939 [Xylaria telfairii]|nr:hypothetical protein F4803DRAFT_283939 [Xylaria telfairii]